MLTKNRKMMMLTLISFLFTTSLFQNCSLSKFNSGTSSTNGGGLDLFSTYAPQSMSGVQNVSSGNVVLKEYRHKSMNRFFYTSRINDQALLESTYASLFEATSNTITIRAAQEAGLSPVYRLFNKAGFHMYTADISEQNTALNNSQYQDEGIEGYAVKINPGATCPASTYPVNRLFHNAQSKYRLVTDTTLKAQLISQGFVDQGILFCATAVSNIAPISAPVSGSCSWAWTDDFAPARPLNQRPILRNINCTSANEGYKQNVTDRSADWTCVCEGPTTPPTIPPISGGSASCAFGNTTLAHGATAPGFASATVPNGSTCNSQSVTCNNGALSNPSYSFNSCTVLPPVSTGSDLCAGQKVFVATNFAIEPSSGYQRRWSTSGGKPLQDISHNMGPGDVMVIPFNVLSTTTTNQGPKWPVSFAFSDAGAQRGGRIVTLSQRRCDFTNTVKLWISPEPSALTANIPLAVNANTQSAVINDTSAQNSGYTNITTGQWYINIKVPVGECPANSFCDFVFDYHGTGQ